MPPADALDASDTPAASATEAPHDGSVDAHHAAHSPGDGDLAADVSVRPARLTDLPAVGQVQAAVWRSAYASILPSEVLHRLEPTSFTRVWERSLRTPPSDQHHLLVALAGARVVGMAAVGPSADPDSTANTGELLLLAVHPDARRTGHGSRLVNAATAALMDAGMAELRAWVLADHEDTQTFLASAGLEPDGGRRSRVVDDQGRTVQELRLSAVLVTEQATSDASGEADVATGSRES